MLFNWHTIKNAVLISDVQQSDAYIYMYDFPYYFLVWFVTKYWISSLCSAVGPCCLSILYLLQWTGQVESHVHWGQKHHYNQGTQADGLCLMISWLTVAAAAESLQSCLTLCEPIDGSPPGSPMPGILQARTLEWVAISFSNAQKWKVKVKSLSRVWFLATPWTAAHQAPLSMGFSRPKYQSGLPLPSPSRLTGVNKWYALNRNPWTLNFGLFTGCQYMVPSFMWC